MNTRNFEDNALLTKLLSRLSRNAFRSFVEILFNTYEPDDSEWGFNIIPDAGEDVYYRELIQSYGGSLHNVYLLHHLPMELFHETNLKKISDPILISKLKNIHQIYKGQKGRWGMVDPYLKYDRKLQNIAFITNFSGIEEEVYRKEIIPEYAKLIKKVRINIPIVNVGSYDSFIALSPEKTKESFNNFISNNVEGLRISLNTESISVDRFYSERNLNCGVLLNSKLPCEPVYITHIKQKESLLQEFEYLIQKNASEAELESFLVSNYKFIFGSNYDRIETQLWLRFPELDITGHKRRIDIFLRNSVQNDWELFEIKRKIFVTKTYRDIPVIISEVSNAIHQIKNYARILSQDSVKKHFAQQGIEYFEPSLNIVVGKTPQIPHEQWRWLLSQNKDVKISTYDDLLKEMKGRLKDYYSLYEI